ncbi:hypothetical protein GHT09_007796 [Marmota monax]|uniref:SEA domain-containing protein n=1 Tax=Marmota monax TaxID=9995 RepID=A0A834PRB2_MARMO|nr:hypothetical protein GHT09_007796 [Marmota monax]
MTSLVLKLANRAEPGRDAQVFGLTIRIVNCNLTEQLLNCSSVEHRDFSRQLLQEVENSFPPAVCDLYRRGKLRMQMASLQVGSVVVKLRITVQDPEFPVGVSTLAPLLQLLPSSTVFQIDQQGTAVQGTHGTVPPGCPSSVVVV